MIKCIKVLQQKNIHQLHITKQQYGCKNFPADVKQNLAE